MATPQEPNATGTDPAFAEVEGVLVDTRHWIGGERVSSASTFEVISPIDETVIAHVHAGGAEEVERAVAAARAAFPAWAAMPVAERSAILRRVADGVEAKVEELSRVETRDNGSLIRSHRRGVMPRVAMNFRFFADYAEQTLGHPDMEVRDHRERVSYDPAGVVAIITPWNAPLMLATWRIGPALAAGNCVVVKPPEWAPLTASMLADITAEAGLPPGVFNVVQGDHVAVNALLCDPRVAAVSFVGSTPVAEHVYRTASQHGKRVQALGGAKNHLVVMPDADMDQVADALLGAGYGSAGERCMAISAVVAVGHSAEPLLERLLPRIAGLKVGPGSDNSNDMGPLITAEHREKVRAYIELGVKEGATLLVDGRQHEMARAPGYFLGPTLFDNATVNMRVYREEIFGPVLTITRVPTFDAAVKLVNAHEFGNGTAIFTRDGDSARTFASRIQVGMVGINVPIPVPLAFHSFGGWKRSLFGDTSMYGMEGVRFYSRLKTVTSRWPTGIRAGADYSMPTG